ncbi:MAG: tRNA (adenosine(37)-N6)-dimethylallyltransferase MiaA [Candidatus Zambryskibacteria bacterium]|nr:tRNA (adenosine(37)-N6)-dimethylallyltransferase MiaA [Candidatus Zambryskibacteria bacterium]
MTPESKKNKDKILVILGPTATGKSDLAVKLGKIYNGEVISADSRQVYKKLNIGTGKITKREMRGVPHHMLDIISLVRLRSPQAKFFSVAEWKKQTEKKIVGIISRRKLPIICGGTGFYIQSIVDNVVVPEVPPNIKLRKKLEKKSVKELFAILKKLDWRRAKNIDAKNPIRLIRAIEIATVLGSIPPIYRPNRNPYRFLQIGLRLPDKDLKKRIHIRLFARIRDGMIKEAQNLHKQGLSWKRMRSLGLEYRYLAEFLQKKISRSEFVQKLKTEIWRYAKRQMTWFKRNKRIKWFKPEQVKKIGKRIDIFLHISKNISRRTI